MKYSAGLVGDYSDGTCKVIKCGETEIGVFLLAGEFFAWHNRCAHLGGPVCQGRILKRVREPVDVEQCVRELQYDETEINIVCPWHGYEYNIRTGRHPGSSSVGLQKATLTIENGEIYVEG